MNSNTNIRKMTVGDKQAVIEMMRVFYTSPAVFSNGSENIFLQDIEACTGENPYLDGYIFAAADSGEIQGYGMVAKSFSTEFGKQCAWIERTWNRKPLYRACQKDLCRLCHSSGSGRRK